MNGMGPARWKTDTGIDPQLGLVDQLRQDEEILGTGNVFLDALSTLAFALTFPVSCCLAFKKVSPTEDLIVSQCGVIKKVLKKPGLHYIDPFFTDIRSVGMGLQDIEIPKMNANDSRGNHVIASAQAVYRISDSISTLKTNNLSKFIRDQAESALRVVLSQYPFDNGDKEGDCLRKHSLSIENHLARVLHEMVEMMGVTIETFRIVCINVAPNMEESILARPRAEAEVQARSAIAEGATGIIHETISRLNALGIHLTEEEQSQFAVNLTYMIINQGHTGLNFYQETAAGKRSSGKEKV